MKHSFTDQQLTDAYKAALKEGTCGDTPADYMRAVVNHLPEPVSDEWQECGFEDIQKGDRVKRVRIYGSGTTDIREGVVANKDIHFASCTQKRILVSAEDLNSPIVKLYRIPAPVQHPDPEVHKYILVHKADPKYNPHIFPNVGMSNGSSGYGVSHIHIPAEYILEWEELTPKVVADDA